MIIECRCEDEFENRLKVLWRVAVKDDRDFKDINILYSPVIILWCVDMFGISTWICFLETACLSTLFLARHSYVALNVLFFADFMINSDFFLQIGWENRMRWRISKMNRKWQFVQYSLQMNEIIIQTIPIYGLIVFEPCYFWWWLSLHFTYQTHCIFLCIYFRCQWFNWGAFTWKERRENIKYMDIRVP